MYVHDIRGRRIAVTNGTRPTGIARGIYHLRSPKSGESLRKLMVK
jgi:hypothetical protein